MMTPGQPRQRELGPVDDIRQPEALLVAWALIAALIALISVQLRTSFE